MNVKIIAVPIAAIALYCAIGATGFSVAQNCPDNSISTESWPAQPSPTTGDPVSTETGDFTYSVKDLEVKGPIPIVFSRCYDSGAGYDGPAAIVGFDWDCSFNRYINFTESNAAVTTASPCAFYHTGQGYTIKMDPTQFNSEGNATQYVGHIPNYVIMTVDSSGNMIVTDKHGNQDFFNPAGSLVQSKDRNGNTLTYTRDSLNRLTCVADAYGHYMTFGYNGNSNLISSVTDSAGREVAFDYTTGLPQTMWPNLPTNRLTQVTYPATTDFPTGITINYQYDMYSRLVNIIDGKGDTATANTYGTSSFGAYQVTQQTGQATGSYYAWVVPNLVGTVERRFTDGNGNVTTYTVNQTSGNFSDRNPYATHTINITSQTVSDGSCHPSEPLGGYTTQYQYDTSNEKTQELEPNGNGTNWTYDSYGNVLTVQKFSPSGATVNSSMGTQGSTTATTTYTYEPRFNQLASETDPNGNVTTYNYGNATSNPSGSLLSITYPTTVAGTAQETYTYNQFGEVVTDTAPDGTVTLNAYDPSTGYLIETIKDYGGSGHLNATTHFVSDAVGHVISTTDPNGNTTNFTYNNLDELVEVDGASGEVEQKSYDQNKNLIVDQKQAPDGAWAKTVYVYNNKQQLTATQEYTDAVDYLTTAKAYDAQGNLTQITDPLGHTKTTTYDERNKAYLFTDALGHTSQYDFDGNENTIRLTDELGHVTTYAFDGLDKLEKKNFPDGTYQTWSYDRNGNTISERTAVGNTITQTFDTRNRKLTQNYTAASGPSTITDVYDIMGRLLTATEGGAALTYVYDNLGRNTHFTDQAGRTSTYGYDLQGNRTSSTYPTGVTWNRAFDASNRPTTTKDSAGNTLVTNTYDILDRMTLTTLANGTTVTNSFDLLNRLTNVDNALGTVARNYSYIYDGASRVVSSTEPRGTIGYAYSTRDEVTGVTEPSGSPFSDQSFVYDAAYNRSNWTLGSTSTNYTANNLDEYTAIGSAAPGWNNDGGLSSYAGYTYTYDALMRLTEVDYSGGKTFFTYDPLGRRVTKVDENSSGSVFSAFSYHYDGSDVAVEYRPSSVTYTYCGTLLREDGSGNKQWYYRDGHDSVSAVADNSGNLLEAYEYTPQGTFQITNASGTVLGATGIGNDTLYVSMRYDSETANYYDNARYYSAVLGRFISRDPLSNAEFSQGTNLYAYCENDYLNRLDPGNGDRHEWH